MVKRCIVGIAILVVLVALLVGINVSISQVSVSSGIPTTTAPITPEFCFPENVHFGQSEGELIQIKGDPDMRDIPIIAYHNSVDYDSKLSDLGADDVWEYYGFSDDNKLIEIVIFIDGDDNALKPYDGVQYISSALTEMYGDPLSEETKWLDDRYQSDSIMWNVAGNEGHWIYAGGWKTPEFNLVVSYGSEDGFCFRYSPSAQK